MADANNDLGIITSNEPSGPEHNRWLMQDGEFSKTGGMFSVAFGLVLVLYFVQSLFHGLVVPLGQQAWTIPPFDIVAAGGIITLAITAYTASRAMKNQANKQAGEQAVKIAVLKASDPAAPNAP